MGYTICHYETELLQLLDLAPYERPLTPSPLHFCSLGFHGKSHKDPMSHDSIKDASCSTLALKNPSTLPPPMPSGPGPCQLCSSVPLANILGYATRDQGQRQVCSGFGLRLLLGLDLCAKREQNPPLHVLLVKESLSTEDTPPPSQEGAHITHQPPGKAPHSTVVN